jgi:hypothetical protein
VSWDKRDDIYYIENKNDILLFYIVCSIAEHYIYRRPIFKSQIPHLFTVIFGFLNCCIWISKFYFEIEYLPKLLLG